MENTEKFSAGELVLRLSQGHEDAFREVFDLYGRKIYGLAYHFLKNSEQSREVVQETMIKLWEHRECLDCNLPLPPYLYTIARRIALNMLRQMATSRSARQKLYRLTYDHHNETEETVISADLQKAVEKTLQVLPWQQQQVFRLSRLDGLSYEKIAARMNISVHTVKYHLTGALKTLRKHFVHTQVVSMLVFCLSPKFFFLFHYPIPVSCVYGI